MVAEQITEQITQWLEPLAAWFRSLGMPAPIVQWGHPVMMGIVVLVMGSYVALTGWRGRLLTATDDAAASKNRADHSKIAPLMFLFITMGYTGGVLSLVMQRHEIFASPHFWTGSIAILVLAFNGFLSSVGFSQGKVFRTIHAYLGSAALVLLLVHGAFGLKLGLSL